MKKVAALKARNYDELAKAISTVTATDGKKMADELLFAKGGSGSLFASLGKKTLNLVTPKSKQGTVLSNKYKDVQRKLSDIDMRAGAKVQDSLSRTPKVGGLFNTNYRVKIDASDAAKLAPNAPETEAIIEASRLSAPIDKAKSAALPTIGAFYLASKIPDGSQNKAGESVEKLSREELIDSILKLAGLAPPEEESRHSILMKKASQALSDAAKESEIKDEIISKLASEVEELKLKVDEKNKAKKCEAIVSDMIKKGIISSNRSEEQLNKLITMSDKDISIFEETIGNVPDALESKHLTGLSEDNNIISKNNLMKHAFETGSVIEQ